MKNSKGFTLLEVVIAVSLLGLVSIVSVTIVSNLLRSAVKSQSAIDVEDTSNFVLLKIKNDLDKSYKAQVNAAGDTLEIFQTPSSSSDVTYIVETCNTNANLKCVKRTQDGIAVNITDSTSDPADITKASNSAIDVSLVGASTNYFTVVQDAAIPPKTLAVNIVMRFTKPVAVSLGNFTGESILDTTIVLPKL